MRWRQWLWRRSERDRRLDAELRDHVERLTADYVAAGMPDDEARRRARLEFGGLEPVKEACRDTRGIRWLDEARQDLRYAFRSLRREPGFTAVAVVTLALGIGASTAVFSVVDAVVLRGLPFDAHDRLLAVGPLAPTPGTLRSIAPQDFLDWRARQTVFEGFTGFTVAQPTVLLESGREPEALAALHVSPGFFDVLRLRPALGRFLTPDEELDGRHAEVVLGYGLWQGRFGGAPDILGRLVSIDGTPYEVVGVAPPGFSYPVGSTPPTQAILPLVIPPDERVRGVGVSAYLQGIGRLRDGVSIARAAGEMDRIGWALEAEHPEWNRDRRVGVLPLHEYVIGDRTRSWMLLLLGAVACVLLIVCANVANLMLARATARDREIGIRAAIGAGRLRIVRQCLVESLVLSCIGTAAGVALAWWGVEILRAAMPDSVPRVASIALDLRVLVVAAAAGVATGLLVGVLPAMQSSRPDLARVLGDSGRGVTAGRARQRTRGALVVVELALAVVLLVGAGLFVTSFVKLMRVDLGFEPRGVLTAVVAPRFDPATMDHVASALVDVAERIAGFPGVEAAAAVAGTSPVTTAVTSTRLTLPGRTIEQADTSLLFSAVTPDYHRALRIPLRQGRYFDSSDRAGAQGVVILSEEAARRHFPDKNPVGSMIGLGTDTRLVIGVVGDVRSVPEARPAALGYVPLAQTIAPAGQLVIRTTGDLQPIVAAVKTAAASVMPDVPLRDVRAFDAVMWNRTAQRRVNMLLLGPLGVLGLVVASVGVYGVMAYVAAQRTREIGVRLALGATRSGMVSMLLRQTAALAAIGLTLGTGGAWVFSATAEAFLFQLVPTDARVFAGSLILLAACTCLASALPAWRAARVDPVVAMRHE